VGLSEHRLTQSGHPAEVDATSTSAAGESTDFQYLSRYNTGTDCQILLKFGIGFDYLTGNTEQTFKVKRSRSQLNVRY